jgi:hypothetical protein
MRARRGGGRIERPAGGGGPSPSRSLAEAEAVIGGNRAGAYPVSRS